MATLQVPEQYYPGFEILVTLNDDEVAKLIEALEKVTPTLMPSTLASQITAHVRRLGTEDAKNVITAILSIYNLLDRQSMTADEVSAEIGKAIAEEQEIPKPANWQVDKFTATLNRYLNIGGHLSIVAKAAGVMLAHDRIFGAAKVLSDIRPVFGSGAVEKPTAAVIVHTLRLSYHENDQHKEFFVTLDTQDVRTLRKILDRADEKTVKLKEVIETSGLFYIDVDEQE